MSHDGLLDYLWIFFGANDINVGTIMGKTDRKISVMGTVSSLFYCPLAGYINHWNNWRRHILGCGGTEAWCLLNGIVGFAAGLMILCQQNHVFINSLEQIVNSTWVALRNSTHVFYRKVNKGAILSTSSVKTEWRPASAQTIHNAVWNYTFTADQECLCFSSQCKLKLPPPLHLDPSGVHHLQNTLEIAFENSRARS